MTTPATPSTWTPPATAAPLAPPVPGTIWLPPQAGVARPRLQKILMNIIGTSGVGKSFLVSQALEDADYGPDEVAVIMHEDGTEAYGPLMKLANLYPVTTPDKAEEELDRLIAGAKRGFRLPKLLFYDSLTGMTDYFQSDKEDNPNMTMARDKEGKPTGEWVRDKRSEYGDMGRWAQKIYLKLRDQIPMDVIVLITSFEGVFNAIPEIACEGKVIPKNITRWSSCTLYMKAVPGKAPPEEIAAEVAAGVPKHRSYGQATDGSFDGTFISRYFTTQNTGEIMAKGHRNLYLTERAILPDVLRKIRGGTPPAVAPHN